MEVYCTGVLLLVLPHQSVVVICLPSYFFLITGLVKGKHQEAETMDVTMVKCIKMTNWIWIFTMVKWCNMSHFGHLTLYHGKMSHLNIGFPIDFPIDFQLISNWFPIKYGHFNKPHPSNDNARWAGLLLRASVRGLGPRCQGTSLAWAAAAPWPKIHQKPPKIPWFYHGWSSSMGISGS